MAVAGARAALGWEAAAALVVAAAAAAATAVPLGVLAAAVESGALAPVAQCQRAHAALADVAANPALHQANAVAPPANAAVAPPSDAAGLAP